MALVVREVVKKPDGSLTLKPDGSLTLQAAAQRGEVSLAEFFTSYDQSLAAATPRRGVRVSDEHLLNVARVYRNALAAGEPPTAAVEKKFFTKRANAGRWVMEARRRGFLDPAPRPRQAGEAKKSKARRKEQGNA